MSVLVTGGAGYIGSHVVRLLQYVGRHVVVVDDLSSGSLEKIPGVPVYEFDIAAPGAQQQLETVIADHAVSAVIHFAAKKQVNESVRNPGLYYSQNIGGMNNLLESMRTHEVSTLVFSSSAAVYGIPSTATVLESASTQPINPYGETKLINEWMCQAANAAWGLRYVALRYFNVAGAGQPELGDTAALNLVPIALKLLTAGKSPVVFGSDYDTEDGTCIRDYIHVQDLAEAHLRALEELESDTEIPTALNVGTGTGSSVLEVLEALKAASGIVIPPTLEPRRAGDPPALVSDASLISESLKWKAKHDLADMAESAWEAWQHTPAT